MSEAVKTHYRACNLCEAICGLEIKTQGTEIISIKGDPNDPLGRGHICPKAVALQDIYADPDRLKQPVKKVDGKWQKISWQEAYDFAVQGMLDIQTRHGKNALALYAGNPKVHNYGSLTHGAMFSKLLKTKNRYSSTSLDQLPLQMMCRLMYGHQLAVPIPDIDHTDYFVIMGGNPVASNGSMMTVPDFKNRIKELQARDGKLVVLDPRRTETAKIADEHHGVLPGTDIYMLLAMINFLFSEKLVRTGHLETLLDNLSKLPELVSAFTLELAEEKSGLPSAVIKDITLKLVNTDKAALYGRMGIST
jgi:anaerobic selenocysteine-containing dehydrogenase